MSTKFNMTRDINGYNGFGIQPTANVDLFSTYLAANAAQSVTVPDNYPNWIAIFSYSPGSSIWVSFDGATAVVPGAAFAAVNSCLNPAARAVTKNQVISFITNDDFLPEIGVEFQIAPPYQN
jgi:hypothetical protein